MWRRYVGGLLTGFAIGGFVVWLTVWTILPEPARTTLATPLFPLVLLAFVLAGENLRIKAGKRHPVEQASRLSVPRE